MLDKKSLELLAAAIDRLDKGFAPLPALAAQSPDVQKLADVLTKTAERLQDNFPYFHPLYAGQMLKPPHPVARLAYALAQFINPNNHALDGGRASSAMEKEVVAQIAAMFGWEEHLGHLCGGDTMANLEALWVAGQLAPGKTILASEQAHYTHQRISGVLQLNFESVQSDSSGRMNLVALEDRLKRGDVGTVVATMGTTATGSVDPLHEILTLSLKYNFRVHADAAYGGYFTLVRTLDDPARKAFDCMNRVDSIVIDPHKHGLQPYGCGCVLFREPAVGRLYHHDSPYTYFSSSELHFGEISLECSRPGAAAVALWATQQLLPLVAEGEFAKGLEAGREAALDLHCRVSEEPRLIAGFRPELDIIFFTTKAASVSAASGLARELFIAAARRDLHLALAEMPVRFLGAAGRGMIQDRPTVTCVRSVLMKPEHQAWMDAIWERLQDSMPEA